MCNYMPARNTSFLSLHDALPISDPAPKPAAILLQVSDISEASGLDPGSLQRAGVEPAGLGDVRHLEQDRDRKSTRLNSSHANNSYAVFCLKKKNTYTA